MERPKLSGIPQTGDILQERYSLEKQLGEGGFAIAFSGKDLIEQQKIAIKVLKLTSEQDLLEFEKEASLTQSLPHPHIVPVLNYVSMGEGRPPYIVMPLATYGSLQSELKEKIKNKEWIPIQRSLLFLTQAGQGLNYMNNNGLIHRDVKPANLLLPEKNFVWVADLGIVKDLVLDPEKSKRLIGTPHFMSPEQINRTPEIPTDQYALAVMAYYLITQELPFNGENPMEVMIQHIKNKPRSLPEAIKNLTMRPDINHKILAALDVSIQKALDKNPDERFSSILLFVEDLMSRYKEASEEDPTKWQIPVKKPKVVFSKEMTQKKETNAMIRQGLEFFKRNNHGKALEVYNRVLSKNPNHIPTLFYIALCYEAMKRNDDALAMTNKVLEMDPKNVNAYIKKVQLLNALQKPEEALVENEKALLAQPDNSDLHFEKGSTLINLQRYEEAVDALNVAIQKNPYEKKFYGKKGLALKQLEQYEEALVAYQHALLHTNYPPPAYYAEMGFILNKLGQYKEATNMYDKFLVADDKAISLRENIRKDPIRKQQYQDAFMAYSNTIYTDHADYNAAHSAATIFFRIGEYQKALNIYNRCIENDSENSLAYFHKAELLSEWKKYDEAIAVYEQALTLDITDITLTIDTFAAIGHALFSQERYEEAIELYNRALQVAPSDINISHILRDKGKTLNRLQRYEEAVESLNTSISTALSTDKLTYTERAETHYWLDNYEASIADCDIVIGKDQRNSKAYHTKSAALIKQGEYLRAQIVLDVAIRINPLDTVAVEYKEKLIKRIKIQKKDK
ncbi:MAG TPA: tetratricopeptide repeat protein [Candidatus Saccharimonadales bacterium]|nr:tetratricopeptide repeat protein [Candidatus Saccharimonadales bacterium]